MVPVTQRLHPAYSEFHRSAYGEISRLTRAAAILEAFPPTTGYMPMRSNGCGHARWISSPLRYIFAATIPQRLQ